MVSSIIAVVEQATSSQKREDLILEADCIQAVATVILVKNCLYPLTLNQRDRQSITAFTNLAPTTWAVTITQVYSSSKEFIVIDTVAIAAIVAIVTIVYQI